MWLFSSDCHYYFVTCWVRGPHSEAGTLAELSWIGAYIYSLMSSNNPVSEIWYFRSMATTMGVVFPFSWLGLLCYDVLQLTFAFNCFFIFAIRKHQRIYAWCFFFFCKGPCRFFLATDGLFYIFGMLHDTHLVDLCNLGCRKIQKITQ